MGLLTDQINATISVSTNTPVMKRLISDWQKTVWQTEYHFLGFGMKLSTTFHQANSTLKNRCNQGGFSVLKTQREKVKIEI